MEIELPEPCLLLLIGPSGSGKSTLAKQHFLPTEVLSSDFCRALVSDSESDQSATDDAFETLHLILSKRMKRRRTTVVDATNVQASSRRTLITAAHLHGVPVAAIVFALPEEVCQARNLQRSERQVPGDVIPKQIATMTASLATLEAEGFQRIFELNGMGQADSITIVRRPG